MNKSLEEILITRFNKDDLISKIDNHPREFDKLLQIALTADQPQAWRAAWLINQLIKKNDKRLVPHLKKIIYSLNSKQNGHQRELLRILYKMNIDENLEVYLLDISISIWENITKNSSARIFAFRHIARIANKYPELKNELKSLTQDHYTESLSPGIKHSFIKLKNDLGLD